MAVRAVAVHWDPVEIAGKVRALEAAGASVVHAEAHDGRRAHDAIRTLQPDLVAVWLQWRPAHGRMLAAALAAAPWGRDIPVLFVDADPDPAPPALLRALREAVPHAIVDHPGRLAFWVERVGVAVEARARAAEAAAASPAP